jgi:hypothetical protein
VVTIDEFDWSFLMVHLRNYYKSTIDIGIEFGNCWDTIVEDNWIVEIKEKIEVMELDDLSDYDSIDYKSISKSKRTLEKYSTELYWGKFNGDWYGYMEEVFQYDTEDNSVSKSFRKVKPEKLHPFVNWI